MNTSEKQIKANRENAKKGGVKTEKGKLIVRLNATKHGIFSNVMISKSEDNHIFSLLQQRVFDELNPIGVLEEILADRIVVCVWRLRRCVIADRAMIEHEDNDPLNSVLCPQTYTHGLTELFARYETTIERQLYKSMRELKDLQRDRIDSMEKTSVVVESIMD